MNRKMIFVISGVMVLCLGPANWIIKKQDEKYDQLLAASKIRDKLISRLIDEVDDIDILRKIKDEYQFDLIVMDLE